mmetsp:Transcript_43190/g.52367  ORF Transcript_43190/g.52367 Transcript_43190/m.52367 type:complete len:176 (-) Transcript_43190:168-695(-)|eukprot:CAMPEP_0197853158 /NCGR_PEP_ID=MMETSP1438-20131217/22201_1 /TAXON_ID=1461541 /ORGANISM="Pterosperma sp., Strain CCMP1384" /LENGTH=175 /DNA_ID=CAMNT_0043467463 /DNA_START=222 /DNA_END=749 /DNA_ORIENTATION=+
MSQALTIFCVTVGNSFLVEGISWFVVYRTIAYQNLVASKDRTSKKVEEMKTSLAGGKAKSARKMSQKEDLLKMTNQQIGFMKWKSNFVLGGIFVIMFSLLGSIYDAVPVARLPFEPLSMMTGMTHRGLPGEDMRDCSFAFIYMLCSSCCRINVQKFLGFSPPRQFPKEWETSLKA